jgi:hypothetical protein
MVKVSMCIAYCWNVLSPKNFQCCTCLRLQFFVWSHIANPVRLVAWRHQAVCEEWLLLRIWQVRYTRPLLATVVSLQCLILHFFYKQFTSYLNLICWQKLNKLFCWFSQRVVVVVVLVIINIFPTVFLDWEYMLFNVPKVIINKNWMKHRECNISTKENIGLWDVPQNVCQTSKLLSLA